MSVSMDSGMSQEIEVVSPDDVCIITQDVWASFLNVHIERIALDETLSGRPSMVGAVRVTDAWFGAVVLEVTPALARTVAATMFDSTPDVVTDAEVVDALGELTNMIGGNIKSLLPAPSHLSLPSVVHSIGLASIPGFTPLSRVAFLAAAEPIFITIWRA
jgi:chemotaxis protein CheX